MTPTEITRQITGKGWLRFLFQSDVITYMNGINFFGFFQSETAEIMSAKKNTDRHKSRRYVGFATKSLPNQGRTSLRRRRRTENKMQEFDRLPLELRQWLATAILPWRPRSAHRSYSKALARTGDRARALGELSRIEQRLITKDARIVWGEDHPFASSQAVS
ncbi:MAG: DUF6525 family protein [Pikeienuella sp.]